MPARGLLFNALVLVMALIAAAVTWVFLGLFGLAIDEPVKAGVGWIGENFGSIGYVAFLIAIPTLGWSLSYVLQRRHLRRQYAQDRTIHVHRPHRFSVRTRIALALGYVAVLFVIFALVPL